MAQAKAKTTGTPGRRCRDRMRALSACPAWHDCDAVMQVKNKLIEVLKVLVKRHQDASG